MCLGYLTHPFLFIDLAVDNLTIVGELETFWKSAVGNIVSAYVVCEVY